MHAIRAIRDDPAAFDAALARRGVATRSPEILALDEDRRKCIAEAEEAKAGLNRASRDIGRVKAGGDETEFERLRTVVAEGKARIAALEAEAKTRDEALQAMLAGLPNLPHDDVPDGKDEADNVEIHRWGEPPVFDFEPKQHHDLPAVRGNMDFRTAARLSGSRFVVLSGAVAHLHRALSQFMLDVHTLENGMTEVNAPVLVRDDAMFGTGQLPKFTEDSYRTTDGRWLIPTSEVSLTNIAGGKIVDERSLPFRYVAHSLCFRSEAGAAGKDTSGMLRQHQFEKVEMVSITHPDRSDAEQERMRRCAEDILERLDIPYRTVVLCVGDMGFGACRTYDIEAWLPGQGTYREISSVSTCGDFQARRMNARYRPEGGGKPAFVHTLNGSGLAVGRCLIAVLENGQRADGSVVLPEALHPYLGGKGRLTAEGDLA